MGESLVWRRRGGRVTIMGGEGCLFVLDDIVLGNCDEQERGQGRQGRGRGQGLTVTGKVKRLLIRVCESKT